MKRVVNIVLSVGMLGCVHRNMDEPVPACNADSPVGFAATVSPIIATKCSTSGCHNGTNIYIPALTSFTEVKDNSADIMVQLSNQAMPPKGSPSLTSVELAVIKCWINQGATTH